MSNPKFTNTYMKKIHPQSAKKSILIGYLFIVYTYIKEVLKIIISIFVYKNKKKTGLD